MLTSLQRGRRRANVVPKEGHCDQEDHVDGIIGYLVKFNERKLRYRGADFFIVKEDLKIFQIK
jgi:hypothetical protein